MAGEKRPFYQTMILWAVFLLVGIAAIGAVMDSYSNALSIVRPSLTYLATPIVVGIWLVIEVLAATVGIHWLFRSGRMRVSGLGPKIRLGFVAVLVLLWIPRIGDIPSRTEEIPLIQVQLVNNSDKALSIARQGEFILWLPSALYGGAPRIGGKFTFRVAGETGYVDSTISLPPHSSTRVVADLLADQIFIRYLEREDTDVCLSVGTSLGSRVSDNMPFMREAIASRYLEWRFDG